MSRHLSFVIALVALTLILAAAYTVGAGPLNPPAGPVAPTQKPLVDVEPRTVIRQADIPLVISTPGSYLLGEDIVPQGGGQTAIVVSADDVTLDLGGFAIRQNNALLLSFVTGIIVNDIAQDVTIKNGHIRGSQSDGIEGQSGSRVRLENIMATSNGGNGIDLADNGHIISCTASNNFGRGINVDDNTILRDCSTSSNGDRGMSAINNCVLERCVSRNDTNFGIVTNSGCSLYRCIVTATQGTPGHGIFVGAYSTANGCTARQNTGNGFANSTTGGQVFESCVAGANGSNGFSAGPGSTLKGCAARNNGFVGISANTSSVVESCTATLNDDDGFTSGSGTVFTGCAARNNGRDNLEADGFDLGESAIATDCISIDNADDGFDLNLASILTRCVAHSNSGCGFFLDELGCVTRDCTATENQEQGFFVSTDGDRFNIIGCMARENNGDGFLVATGAIFGRLVQCQTANDTYDLGPSTNFVGDVQTSIPPSNPMTDDPWGNVDG